MKTRPWITVQELDNPNHIDAYDSIQAASLILFMMSGQKYPGLQTVTEQYVCEPTGAPTGCSWDPGRRAWWNPGIYGFTYVMGPTEQSTRLLPGKRLKLTHSPVREINTITISGTLVDPATYELLNGTLVNRDSGWGWCDGPVVTYTFGSKPPALGRMAARRLANELILAADGDDSCALPSRATSVSRQGLTLQIFDPQDFMDKGHTGLYEVDLFIATVNPGKNKKRAKVFSPDQRRGYRSS